MFIGYARISTNDQKLDLQIDDLKKAGCEKIYSDISSGTKAERKGLDELIEFIRKGDTLVVWKLDRLGRSLKHLIATVHDLEERGIGFKSLQEGINTTTSGGKLIFHLFGALAEFEKDVIRERTKAGLKAARSRGKLGGRPKKLSDSDIELLNKLYQDHSIPIETICLKLKISRPTLYRYIKK